MRGVREEDKVVMGESLNEGTSSIMTVNRPDALLCNVLFSS
jgi:hypothetical protein